MIFQRLILEPVFVDLATSGITEHKYMATVDSGFESIHDIVNIHKYGHFAADYVRSTKEMATLFDNKTGATEQLKWDNCSDTEKDCLAQRHIVSKTLRLQRHSTAEDEACFCEHALSSTRCRTNRILASKIAIGYEIEAIVDRQDLFTTVFDKIERFVNTNDPDLTNWMKSLGPYVLAGFKELKETYYTQAIEDTFTLIVVDGVYKNLNA